MSGRSIVDTVARRVATFSGWQRIFVIATLIWLGVCAYVTYFEFPTESTIRATISEGWRSTFSELAEQKKQYDAKCSMVGDGDGDFARYMKCKENLKGDVVRWREETSRWTKVMAEETSAKISELPTMQALALGKALLLWFLPSVIVYLSVAWISAGFKKR